MKKTPLKRKKVWNYERASKGSTTHYKPHRTPLRPISLATSAQLKKDIQATLRDIAIIRDGGCIFRNLTTVPPCNGYAKDGHLILQYDHLITRGNTATFADSRLGVCVCVGHHGWKKWNKEYYDKITYELIGKKRADLWDKMEVERHQKTSYKGAYDWKLIKIALGKELADAP